MNGSKPTLNKRSVEGFTYVAVLMLVFVTGLALTGASYSWTTIIQREKEAELLFRGNQIREAIKFYVQNSPNAENPEYPQQLKDLLSDPRSQVKKRYLRKIYIDPMTKEGHWGVIYEKKKGIRGVHSLSPKSPIKKGNFLKIDEKFKNATSYSDWKFIFIPEEKKAVGNNKKEPDQKTDNE